MDELNETQFVLIQQKAILQFDQWLDQIYIEQCTVKQLLMYNQIVELELSDGQAYTLIRDKLQRFSAIHRRFINSSLDILFKNSTAFDKKLQTAISIISHHFQSMITANREACLLWQTLGLKKFQIKADNLDQLCLKQLIPSNIYMPFRKLYEHMGKMIKLKTSDESIQKLYNKSTRLLTISQDMGVINIKDALNKKQQSQKRKQQLLQDFKNIEDKQIEDTIQDLLILPELEQKKSKKKNRKKKKKNKEKTIQDQKGNNDNIVNNKQQPIVKYQIQWLPRQRELLELLQNFQLDDNNRIECNLSDDYIQSLYEQ